MTTICLNMIVKNESKVITRALSSIKHKIDYWVIVDTGSTDGTQQIIQDFLKDIPGELHERPWVDFAHNRNEALDLSKNKADFLLFIDADEEWVFSEDFDKSALYHNFYVVRNRDLNIDLHRILLVNTKLPWRWKGVLHEEIKVPYVVFGDILPGVTNYGLPRDGHRAQDPQRYQKDAAILEKALLSEPSNPRYVFFLAQSYATAGNLPLALKNYQKRAQMGGFRPEIFWSLFAIGCIQQDLQMDEKTILQSYQKAFAFDPTRAEPLERLAAYYQTQENPFLTYLLTEYALKLPPPTSLSYILREVYDYGLLMKYAWSCQKLGKLFEAKQSYEKLLAIPGLPSEIKIAVEHNKKFLKNH